MTSLQNSVLGFTGNEFDPLPEEAVTMAEHFHRGGYQTAVFTGNPLASTASGLERGVDTLPNPQRRERDARSSVILHDAFGRWRDVAPGQPYWAHFQTTDVHAVGPSGLNVSPDVPIPPFAGLFVSPDDVSTLRAWSAQVVAGGGRQESKAFTTGEIDRRDFFALYQGMYDQQMAHNDYQIGRLVDRLKASGEWQHTLLVVASDHSVGSTVGDSLIGVLDPLPPSWLSPAFRPSTSRVPLIVVWPGHIAGGQRFNDAVSMIDVLPTVLDLAGLPKPEVIQGQSLAPLLRGLPGWAPKPVILEEVWMNPSTSQIRRGSIEVVDGRWGASMDMRPQPQQLAAGRPWPVLLFDLWNDPLCVAPINEQYSDLVIKYTTFLEDQWQAHQALAKQFTPGPKVALTAEQLERLRALGYIR
jgi:arylsulfatase A-like enzyme